MRKYTKIGHARSYIKIKYIGKKIFETEKEIKLIMPNKKQKTLVKI